MWEDGRSFEQKKTEDESALKARQGFSDEREREREITVGRKVTVFDLLL